MDDRHLQALSRFFDGESVDPRLLVESLAHPEAAHHLAQWAALRAWAREDDSRPSARFYEAMPAVLHPPRTRRAFWERWTGPAIAASLMFVAGMAGFRMGTANRGIGPLVPPLAPSITVAATSRPTGASATVVTPAPVPLPVSPRPRQDRSRASGDWPIAGARLRFDAWRETRRGGED